MSKQIIMYGGLPKSGKSTHIKENYIDTNKIITSMDLDNKLILKTDTYIIKFVLNYTLYYILDKYNIKNKTNDTKENEDKFFILSTDDIRLAIHKQIYIQNYEPFIWAIRNLILQYLIDNDYNIILDDTNLTIKRRDSLFDKIHYVGKYNHIITYNFIYVDFDIILSRIKDKDFQKAVKRKALGREPATTYEGFDFINRYPPLL